MRNLVQIMHGAPGNAQSRRAVLYNQLAGNVAGQDRMPNRDGCSACCRRHGRLEALRSIGHRNHRMRSSGKCARLPAPSETRNEGPASVTIRHPTPRIRRDPGVSEPGIEHPRTIRERTPSRACKIRLPHRAVAGHVGVVAVIVQIADTVCVGIIVRGAAARVCLLIFCLLLVPGIEGHFVDVFRERVLVLVGEVENRRFIFADLHLSGRAVHF